MKNRVVKLGSLIILFAMLSGCSMAKDARDDSTSDEPTPSILPSVAPQPQDDELDGESDLIVAKLALIYIPDLYKQSQPGGSPINYNLSCNLDGTASGSYEEPSTACKYLSENKSIYLEPIDKKKGIICTKIYGGPESMLIAGTINGEEFEIALNRSDGCKISEWESWIPAFPDLPEPKLNNN